MKQTQKRGRGRPKGPDVAKLNVEIRPDIRQRLDAYKSEKKWTLKVAVETILDEHLPKLN